MPAPVQNLNPDAQAALNSGEALSNGNVPTQVAVPGQANAPISNTPPPVNVNSTTLGPSNSLPITQPTASTPVTVPPLSTPPLTATPAENNESSLDSQIADLNNELAGKSAAQTAAENAQGLPALEQTVNDLTARSTALTNQATAIPLQEQQDAAGRGITAAGLAPIQTADLRNNAIQALSVNSLLESAHGNVTYAQSLADKAVAAQFDPIQAKITALTANLNLIKNDPQTSLEDKNRAQAQLDAQKTQQDALDAAKANATAVNTVALSAATNVKNFTPTAAYPTASQALDAIQKATTPAQAQAIATASGLVAPAKLDTSVQDIGGRKVLINNQTGETLKDLGAATVTSTVADQKSAALDNLTNIVTTNNNGKPLPGTNGVPVIDSSGFITPQGLAVALSAAPSEGLTEADVINQLKPYLATDKDGTVMSTYKLNAALAKLVNPA